MIRIARGSEPAVLPPIRTAELLRVRPLVNVGTLDSNALGHQYAAVKHMLWEQQEMKCCYCERRTECTYYDVEHFRPKARADRLNGTVYSGYWWLSWTWENLLFSCPNCNRSAKNDAFPLEIGSVPLAPEEQPPGQELSTLINPYDEDSIDLIQFVHDGKYWRPTGRNGSVRGQRTIEILKLDRPELLTLYNAHVKDYVVERVSDVREAIADQDANRTRSKWNRLVRALLTPRVPFVALSFDAIDHSFSENVRKKWGLDLPRPPVRDS